MPYPGDGAPIKMQVLEAIRANMAAIAPPDFKHRVVAAHIFRGDSLVVGNALPQIVIAQVDDARSTFLTCATVNREMEIAIVGAVRYVAGSEDWTEQIGFLLADINNALALDEQLGGLAVWIDSHHDELFDANPTESLAFGQVLARVSYRHAALNPSSVT